MSACVPKSKCRHCVEGVVFSEDCNKVLGHFFCEIDAKFDDVPCSPDGCHYYERKTEDATSKESEVIK